MIERKMTGLRLEVGRRALALAATAALLSGGATVLSSENVTLTTSYPSPAGIYRRIVTTEETILARNAGNVGVGTSSPNAAAPNNVLQGNIESNDVFLRSTNQWLSQASSLKSLWVGSCYTLWGTCKCNMGETMMLLSGRWNHLGGSGIQDCMVFNQGSPAVYAWCGDYMYTAVMAECFK